jgi:hypothetical protein
VELDIVPIDKPEDLNVIPGQAHFIKTVEDIHEALAGASPRLRFGVAFCEASGPCLIRRTGNDEEWVELATRNAHAIDAGHCFVVFVRAGYPVNVLNQLKQVPEVCSIFCATANPVEVIVAETDLGRGVIGGIDGFIPAGVEADADVRDRKDLLRAIGYKL